MTSSRRKTLHEFFRPEEYDLQKTRILFLEADIQTDSGTVTVQSGDIVSLKNNKNGVSSGKSSAWLPLNQIDRCKCNICLW